MSRVTSIVTSSHITMTLPSGNEMTLNLKSPISKSELQALIRMLRLFIEESVMLSSHPDAEARKQQLESQRM